MMHSNRKRGDSSSSAGSASSPKTKSRGERLIDSSGPHRFVGTSFVSGSAGVSTHLVTEVSRKAVQFTMTFDNDQDDIVVYYGQGGLILGAKIADTPVRGVRANNDNNRRRNKRRRVAFSEYASYEATPVTAKHNLELTDNDRTCLGATIRFFDGEKSVTMPDGGCTLDGEIEVRPATTDKSALTWEADDVSFGVTHSSPQSSLTKKPRLFVKAPGTFRLQVGHKIGIAVFRTFDITHEDAYAPAGVKLENIYGPKGQVCIYTGEVTEVSANDVTFCHSINTFAGCSGAVIFLLDDENQDDLPRGVEPGMAVGIHVGGLDADNNIGFIFSSTDLNAGA